MEANEMTYGVYTRDMRGMCLSEQPSIEACKKYLWSDYVVCSEKRHLSGWGFKIMFHKWHGFHYWKSYSTYVLGFITFGLQRIYYSWADKIVYDPKQEGGAK